MVKYREEKHVHVHCIWEEFANLGIKTSVKKKKNHTIDLHCKDFLKHIVICLIRVRKTFSLTENFNPKKNSN